MKLRQNKKIYKITLLIIAALLVLGVGTYTLYASTGSLFGWQPFEQTTQSNEDAQQSTGQQIKEDSLSNDGTLSTDTPAAPEADAKDVMGQHVHPPNLAVQQNQDHVVDEIPNLNSERVLEYRGP